MKKRIVSFILVLVMVIGLMPTVVLAASTTRFAGGSGTKNDPYLISNKTHLDNVRNYLSAHFKMTADIEFTDADFKYGGGFYNSGKGWMPIGMNLDSAFTGTFDGNGFAIKNLYINISSSASTEYAYAGLFGYNKGTIKNLGLVDGEVLSSFPSVSFAGSIAGFNEGAIENCYNTGNVSASSDDSYAYAGGIAGWSAGEIINCYNTGAVAALSSSSESYAYSYAGGVAAENGGTIKNCYNTGAVSATSLYCSACDGGIVGYNNYYGTIQNSNNSGNVSASSSSSLSYVESHVYVGGLVGENEGAIQTCYNIGKVSASSSSSYPDAYAYAGGITGYNYNGIIKNCYNSGETSAYFEDGYADAGGIAGYNNDGTIENCYNTGKISASSFSTHAGGIAGYNNDGTIENCYNTGEVSTLAYKVSAGGIAGANVGTIQNCYYFDIISKGVDSGTDTTVKCTADKLKQQSTFVGFDFENVWTMEGTDCYPYPELKNVSFTSGHVFDNACDTNCACGYERSTTHSYGEYVHNKDATTKKDGTKTRTCSLCGNKQTVTDAGTKLQNNNPFVDVKKNDFYYEPVLWAVHYGITSGTSKTTFGPNEACTRGQIATFLWRAADCPEPKTSNNPFTDVKKSDYYYKAVLWAVGEGITSGTSKTTFGPNEACTRGQIATFLWRSAGTPKPKTSNNPFTDIKKSDYYYNAVLWAVGEGITAGATKTTFQPNAPCTRGQIATFLYRSYN